MNNNNNNNNRDAIRRVNWYDGINPQNSEFVDEQQGILARSNFIVSDFNGSGVVQKKQLNMAPLLDTGAPSSLNLSYSTINNPLMIFLPYYNYIVR